MDSSELSLRPMTLRPGGGKANPFAGFVKGSGHGIKTKAAPASDNLMESRRKPEGERIRYPREFLMKFSDVFMKMPPSLEGSKLEILLSTDDITRSVQKEVIKRVAEDLDDSRDWRTRQPLPELPAGAADTMRAAQQQRGPQPAGQGQPAPSRDASAGGQWNQNAPTTAPQAIGVDKLKSAAESGNKAWEIGMTAEGTEKALKQVKGVLNKLTPEKFERLLGQLLSAITTLEVLQGTIRLVFENAVVQPTFVGLYAELCNRLSVELPQFPPPPGEDQPISFRRVLLNTCQDEYEAAIEAFENLSKLPAEEAEAAGPRVKSALMGSVRLIAELYVRDVVVEKIMHLLLADMLGGQGAVPAEDKLEAVTEMIRIGGKKLDASEKGRPRLDGYMRTIERLSNDKALPSRIRFLLKDVLELRRSKWVPRREKTQAKKISEVHAEAQAELGMIPSQMMTLQHVAPDLPGLRRAAAADVEMFPAFKGTDAGWEAIGKAGLSGDDGKYSALLGDYMEPPTPQEQAAAAEATAAEAAAQVEPLRHLKPEERDSRARGLFSEYINGGDEAEALLSARELLVEGYGRKLAEAGLEKMLDCPKERDQAAVAEALALLTTQGPLSGADVAAALGTFTGQLEDLALDVPYAPKALGEVAGAVAAAGAADFAAFAGGVTAETVESAEPRRAFWAAALKTIQAKGGNDKLKEVVGGTDLGPLLASDPEFDGELPDANAWLKEHGLDALAA